MNWMEKLEGTLLDTFLKWMSVKTEIEREREIGGGGEVEENREKNTFCDN